jgi:hypothetical protein
MICGARLFWTIACATGHGNGCAHACHLLHRVVGYLVRHREHRGRLHNHWRTTTIGSRHASTAARRRSGVARLAR